MTIEREFASAIFFLYALDCVHWLKPGQMALTRRLKGGWRTQPFCDDSYTLLGRMPAFVNPIDFRPSFLAGTIEELGDQESTIPDLVNACVPAAKVLTMLAGLSAINLLLFLPILLLTGFLAVWWPVSVCILLLTQFGLTFKVFEQGTEWRQEHPIDFWQHFLSLLLNPLAALRSGDVLLRGMFRTRIQQKRLG
jgi:hypothetical protein